MSLKALTLTNASPRTDLDEAVLLAQPKPKTSASGPWNTGWRLWDAAEIDDDELAAMQRPAHVSGMGEGWNVEEGTGAMVYGASCEGSGTEYLRVPFYSTPKYRTQLEKLSMRDPAEKGILKVEGKDGMAVNLACFWELCEALKNNLSLRKLDLDNTQIGNDGVMALSEMLRVNSRVHKLDLQGCKIDDKGFGVLVEALQARDIRMKELYMSRNDITDASVPSIVALCCRSPGLKFYSGNTLVSEVQRSLNEAVIERMTRQKLSNQTSSNNREGDDDGSEEEEEEEDDDDDVSEEEEDDDDIPLVLRNTETPNQSEQSRHNVDALAHTSVARMEGESEEDDAIVFVGQRSSIIAQERAARTRALSESSSSEDSDKQQHGGTAATQLRRKRRRRRVRRVAGSGSRSPNSSSSSSSSSSSPSSDSDASFLVTRAPVF